MSVTPPIVEADGQAEDAELMARYAITCVPAYRYYYRTYSYTSLGDAVAQARRDERRS